MFIKKSAAKLICFELFKHFFAKKWHAKITITTLIISK